MSWKSGYLAMLDDLKVSARPCRSESTFASMTFYVLSGYNVRACFSVAANIGDKAEMWQRPRG